ncbi:alpha/beta hydrolase [Nocardia sp. CA2R105]|uniref:alpha/beta fold hydrolase n=1 Tax=Nocardia coffeae TaxID=2873381 RepID=UPI001CA730BB|nr:alpha/beta hydrolase [Nocardia coffeae]MBY8859089.1 alpha/beta hydrolase [Nocardia coffeae]
MTDTPRIQRGYAPSSFGQLHYAECGSATPILMLHQTPRSWTEYLSVLPLVGAEYRAIAMDTLGYGGSAKPTGPHSVERWADAAQEFVDALGLDRFHLVGHHTGGAIAVELAARLGDRVRSLLLSGTPYIDEEKRRTAGERRMVDYVEPRPDGSHLLELWNNRREFYLPGEEDALNRFMIDALTVLDRVEEGHEAVRRSMLDQRLARVAARTLAICAENDHFSMPALEKFATLHSIPTRVVPGGHVPLPEQQPVEFARIVVEWAAKD